MSTLDQKQTYAKRHVRFTPKSRHMQCNTPCPLWAKSGHRDKTVHFVFDIIRFLLVEAGDVRKDLDLLCFRRICASERRDCSAATSIDDAADSNHQADAVAEV